MTDVYPGVFHRARPTWKACDIRRKSEGTWSLFYDGETDRSLNQDHPRCPDPCPLYRHKRAPKPTPTREPDDFPPTPIHGSLPPPKCFTHIDRVYDPRRIACAADIDPPQRTSAKYLRGDDAKRTHSRASQQPRPPPPPADAKQTLEPGPLLSVRLSRTRSEQSPRRPRRTPSEPGVPSLFARSLKSRILPIPEWETSYHFTME